MLEFHPYIASETVIVDGAGRLRALCAQCGKVANSARHSTPEANASRAAKVSAAKRGKPRSRKGLTEPQLAAPDIDEAGQPITRDVHSRDWFEGYAAATQERTGTRRRIADWRLTMLKHSLELVLEGPELSYQCRIALLNARGALRSELHGTSATEIGAELYGPPAPAERPELETVDEPRALRPSRVASSSSERLRAVLRGFRGDKYRELFTRAVDAGWRWELLGSGHVRLLGPDGASITLSHSARAGRGHGFANLKAAARRAGLDVVGL